MASLEGVDFRYLQVEAALQISVLLLPAVSMVSYSIRPNHISYPIR